MVESCCEKLFSLILSKIFRLVVIFSGLWKEYILTQFHCFICFNCLDNRLGTQCLNLKTGQLVVVNMFTLSFLCSDFNLLFSTTFFCHFIICHLQTKHSITIQLRGHFRKPCSVFVFYFPYCGGLNQVKSILYKTKNTQLYGNYLQYFMTTIVRIWITTQ